MGTQGLLRRVAAVEAIVIILSGRFCWGTRSLGSTEI